MLLRSCNQSSSLKIYSSTLKNFLQLPKRELYFLLYGLSKLVDTWHLPACPFALYVDNRIICYSKQIEEIPREIIVLSKSPFLKVLNFSSNRLQFLPKEIGMLKNLIELHLSDNLLLSLPEEIGLLENLKELYLGDNKLEKLPDSFSQLCNLKHLYIFGNQIKDISNIKWENLSKLKTLCLFENPLTDVPHCLYRIVPDLRL